MTRGKPDRVAHTDADADQLRPLLPLFATVEQWAVRSGQAFSPIQPGSLLASDDEMTVPYQSSHAAATALGHAVDHLHCLRTLLVEAHALHTYSPYSLLRSGLENFCTAVWLLAPVDGGQRVLRRLQLAAADVKRGEEVRVLVGAPAPRPLEERLRALGETAERAGVSRDSVLGGTPGFERIVGEAGDHTKLGGDVTRAVWKTCSGITHGQMWAGLSILERVVVAEDAGVHSLRLSASERGLVTITRVVMDVGQEAWRLYDHRRLTFHGHPPRS